MVERDVVVAKAATIEKCLARVAEVRSRAGNAELALRMRAAMGFRDVAVHAYETVDPKIVEAIATHHVHDLRRFASQRIERYAK